MLENSSTSNLSRIEIKRLKLLKDLSEIHSSTLLNLFTWLKQQNTRWINFDVIRETLPRLSLTYNQERNYGMRPIEFETNDSLTHFLCFVNRAAKLVAYRKLYFVLLDHFFWCSMVEKRSFFHLFTLQILSFGTVSFVLEVNTNFKYEKQNEVQTVSSSKDRKKCFK